MRGPQRRWHAEDHKAGKQDPKVLIPLLRGLECSEGLSKLVVLSRVSEQPVVKGPGGASRLNLRI
eukprot:COSAG03_NODE_5025_length_1360_cov_20.320381_2_plen_65_part_00